MGRLTTAVHYRSESGLAHREGNLHPGRTACGHHEIADLKVESGYPDNLRCWTCYRIGHFR